MKHLHYDLLKEEIEAKNYLWKTLEHDDDVSGDIIVPFSSARASSVKAGGGPSALGDIAQNEYVRGSISQPNLPKTWASLLFNHEDIMSHEGKVKAKSFLGKFLPEQIEDMSLYFSESINHSVLNKAERDVAYAVGTAGGLLEVYRPERFEIGEKLIFDPAGANVTGYVRAIDMNKSNNTGELTVYDARSGGAVVDLSGVAAGEKIYKDGFQTSANQMTSLRDALLSSANGGDTNIYGVTKTASKYTQATNISGADITASNILTKLFDGITIFKRKSKVGVVEIWLSLKWLAAIQKLLEQDKGPYKAIPGSMKTNEFGFTEITIFGPKSGGIKVVGLQELDDDVIYGIDPKSMKFHSIKGIQKVKSPDGNFYTVNRDTSNGYSFVTDMLYRGDLVISKPHRNCVFYGVPTT
jgi:hypothetical protein